MCHFRHARLAFIVFGNLPHGSPRRGHATKAKDSLGAIMKKLLLGLAVFFSLAQSVFVDTSAKAQSAAPLFNWGSDPASQRWSVYIGGISAQRSTPDSSTVITPPTGTPGVILNANAFDFDSKTFPEFVLQYKFDGGWMVEGRYFNTGTSSASNSILNITTFRIAGIGVTILGSGDLANTYSSQLKSAEFNVYKEFTPGFALLAGYRSLRFDDHLRIALASTGLNISDWNDSSSLNGAQIGASLTLFAPGIPLQFNATAKTGWYHNSISNDFTSNVVSRNSQSASNTAQVSELDVTATYRVTNNLSLRAGYMFLWMNKVGIAGDAAPTTVQGGGGTSSPVATGNAMYQGVTFGAAITF